MWTSCPKKCKSTELCPITLLTSQYQGEWSQKTSERSHLLPRQTIKDCTEKVTWSATSLLINSSWSACSCTRVSCWVFLFSLWLQMTYGTYRAIKNPPWAAVRRSAVTRMLQLTVFSPTGSLAMDPSPQVVVWTSANNLWVACLCHFNYNNMSLLPIHMYCVLRLGNTLATYKWHPFFLPAISRLNS